MTWATTFYSLWLDETMSHFVGPSSTRGANDMAAGPAQDKYAAPG